MVIRDSFYFLFPYSLSWKGFRNLYTGSCSKPVVVICLLNVNELSNFFDDYASLSTTGRAKVKTDTEIRQELADNVLEEIKELESTIVSLFNETERKHTREREGISKMKYAKYAALASKYPGLHAFDPEIPKLKKK